MFSKSISPLLWILGVFFPAAASDYLFESLLTLPSGGTSIQAVNKYKKWILTRVINIETYFDRLGTSYLSENWEGTERGCEAYIFPCTWRWEPKQNERPRFKKRESIRYPFLSLLPFCRLFRPVNIESTVGEKYISHSMTKWGVSFFLLIGFWWEYHTNFLWTIIQQVLT